MARSKYRDISVTKDGNNHFLVVPNPSLTIYEPGTTTPVAQTIYAGPTGGTTKTNPFIGAADGSFEFWLDNAQRVDVRHDGTASGFGIVTVAYDPVHPDPASLLVNHPTIAVAFDGLTSAAGTPLTVRPGYTGIRAINVTAAGTGYTSNPTVTITGGGGSGATATATRSGTTVASIAVVTPGTGYTSTPTVTISGGAGSGATAVADWGDPGLLVQNRAGSTVFEVGQLGGGGPYAYLPAAYVNAGVGPLIVTNVRNWDKTSDFFVVMSLMGSTERGSHQMGQFTYLRASQPNDGFGGSVNVPDEVACNFDYFAVNTLFGAGQNNDGSGRSIELQCMVFQNTGQRSMACATVGTHTAVSKNTKLDNYLVGGAVTTEYGDCGFIIHNQAQPYTGFGTTIRANTGILIVGNPGWKQAIGYLNTDDSLLWAVDQAGAITGGNVYPRANVTYTLGGPTTKIWAQVWSSAILAGNGSAANPAVAFTGAGAYSDGLFGVVGAGVVGVGIAGTEKVRWDANGVQHAGNVRTTGIVSPAALGSNTDNYNPTGLGSARILRISASTPVNLNGLAAQSDGFTVRLINVNTNAITLVHEAGTSTAANRFNLGSGANKVLAVHSSIDLWYDASGSRWKASDTL